MLTRIFYILFFLSCFSFISNAQYTIKGRVNVSEDWQPKIFMAAIEKLDDYYRPSADIIVNTGKINEDGTFLLQGDLPNEKKFYRLYLMKKLNTDYDACLYVGGEDHNFVHILLGKNETVEVIADSLSNAPFGNYVIKGSMENQMMRNLSNIVFPSIYTTKSIFPAQIIAQQRTLQSNLKTFIDTCRSTPVALAAINTTDFDENFESDNDFYLSFADRLKKEMSKASYTQDYLRKLRYYSNEELSIPSWIYGLIGILSSLLLALFLQNNNLKKQISEIENNKSVASQNGNSQVALEDILTQKEKEILQLISEGKSNKEIAAEQYVELSTVKTHINKIYSKIGASNRKEAVSLAKKIFN